MSRWFRHYAGMVRDEKLVRVALRSKQPIERVVWVWGAILESAAEINDGGRYDLDAAEAAHFLRADEADICTVFNALADAGRVAEGAVVHWGARQFQSDHSAPRQAAYRERKRKNRGDVDNRQGDGEVTAASRHGDAPESESESKTKTDINLLKGGQDRKANGWRPPNHGTKSKKHGTVYFRTGTPEWAAYAEDYRSAHHTDPPVDDNGGHWFKILGELRRA